MRVEVADAIAPEGGAHLREHGCEVAEVEADFARLIRLA